MNSRRLTVNVSRASGGKDSTALLRCGISILSMFSLGPPTAVSTISAISPLHPAQQTFLKLIDWSERANNGLCSAAGDTSGQGVE
jgi:hypothetical protein